MTNSSKTKLILSSIYSGIGLGLLMGIIMGLSISPTVKIVIGTLASLLGGLLGLENKLGKPDDSEHSALERNIKLGSFGFAVVAGILFGITIRTHDLFAPTISERVQTWMDAGYDSASARKYVLYEKLQIDPITGQATSSSGEIQSKNISALFKSSDEETISSQLDTVFFKGDIEIAKNQLRKMKNATLDDLLNFTSEVVAEKDQMPFLAILQQMTFLVEEKKENYCTLQDDTLEWKGELEKKLANLLIDVNYKSRPALIDKIRKFLCTTK